MIVKVWNDNTHDYKTKFKGDDITIPAKGYIEMDRFEANDFRGQYHPMAIAANGLQDPATFKMIRIEMPGAAEKEEVPTHVCMQCRRNYESEPVLKAHIETAHADAARLEIPEVDEEIKATRGRPKKAG